MLPSGGGLRASNIARWDGTNWFALGSGVDGSVYSIASVAGRVYIGGAFGRAGNKPSLNFAIWHIPQLLQIQLAEGVVFLRWSTAATDYVLEATDSLVQPDWANFVPAPLVMDDRFTATNVLSSYSRFYRLRRH